MPGLLKSLAASVLALQAGNGAAMMTWPSTDTYHMVDPVFTPYYANRSVNLEVIPTYAKLCVKNEVDVVLLGGSTAEWPSLTSEERLDLLSAWRKALDAFPKAQRPQLLFHAGDVSIEKGRYLASKSKAHGADAILIVAPCIMKPSSVSDLVSSIKAVAAEAPELPSIYYHYPELYGVDFPMDQFAAAAAKAIPTFAGVKFIDHDMKGLTSATGVSEKLTFFNNAPLLAGLASGSKGAIAYTTMFPLAKKMSKLFNAGKFEQARSVEREILKYEGIVNAYGGKAGARALPQVFDSKLIMGMPRAPLEGLADSELPKLRQDLIKAGFLKGEADATETHDAASTAHASSNLVVL